MLALMTLLSSLASEETKMNFKKRLQSLQSLMKDIPVDALLIEESVNLLYLTGLELSSGKLLIGPVTATLIVDGRYLEAAQKKSPIPTVLDEDHTLKSLFNSESLREIQTLAFDSENTSFQKYVDLQKLIDKINEGRSNPITLVPRESPVKRLRSIKDADEIDLLQKAADLGSEGFAYVCSLLKEGISEAEVALELEIFWRRRGGKKLAFDPIIAFGANSSMPHYRSGKTKLEKGMPVLIDIGVNLENYHSDMTRVVFFGKPETEMENIYTIVRTAQENALKLCRAGMQIGELDREVREFIAEKGYGEYYPHSLGHGIGLEIHEFPLLRDKPPYRDLLLEEGMVVTIEPGVYLPNIGGVRIEDTILITKTGYENLTRPSKDFIYL
jgi:Xaa-Pro aminopeptidase